MGTLTRLIPPTDPAATEDAFAEFAPEPASTIEAAEERDWFAEFPEEGGVNAAPRQAPGKPRPTAWLMLSESLKTEKA